MFNGVEAKALPRARKIIVCVSSYREKNKKDKRL